MIKKILIANRGEIAIRVMRSCRELGIETVSVHSTIDETSLHVKIADESVCIGPPAALQSYLNMHAILSAVEITGADAVHPGYGFLSENHEFARMCAKCGIVFVGPTPECLEVMGSKIRSKEIAKKAGVPILEAIAINNASENEILEKVAELQYPVIIKASAGGGGRGMKVINNDRDLLDSISTLKRESLLAFGDDTLFIEKYITNPRHIEVQVIADNFGNAVHLGERDCTIQRRYQKLIEESPSPVLTEAVREEICEAALALTRAVNYNSVGTVEFIFDQDSEKFYFMEMNTRIQVEHPVTEMRCNFDLISEQIKIANGEKLSVSQQDITWSDHVIECRINAENPKTMRPSPGKIDHYHRPGGLGIRVDDYIYTGYSVPPHYDSMLSKVIVKGRTREEAIKRMLRALDEMIVGGIETNIELHKKILLNKNFQENKYSTKFLETL
ncbi:MAG: acetyl-CoA carboxylase biotin carboxylase subunit [Halobacteriovoraceae bacterium]|nr:acetyl-CoA carboxylase biotin carboxylase subunit [Halobacteriovoraceae bacterium]